MNFKFFDKVAEFQQLIVRKHLVKVDGSSYHWELFYVLIPLAWRLRVSQTITVFIREASFVTL